MILAGICQEALISTLDWHLTQHNVMGQVSHKGCMCCCAVECCSIAMVPAFLAMRIEALHLPQTITLLNC